MRSLKLWASLVHVLLLCLVTVRLAAAPSLTTIQDTLYKADGTRFNGVAYIEWKSFQSSDASAIATANVVVPISSGTLRVRLVPTTNASVGAHYVVRYHADGRVQFTETWNVPPSSVTLNIASVRVSSVSGGSEVNPPANLGIEDIIGLVDELASRPVKGFVYAPNRILMTGPTGALESVQGTLTDCIRVDGTTGPCGSGSTGSAGPEFVDQEVPAGTPNGSNLVFTLSQPPSPASSLQLFRNGIFLKANEDYSLSGATITFGAQSVPQTGDLLLASYRLASAGNPSGLAAGALTGSFPAPQIADGVITNANIAANAGIVESKLALNHATHSNANDPSSDQKAALSGTAGSPSATNKYVTDADTRLSDSRNPSGHTLLGTAHSDTEPAVVQRGDLIVGANNGPAKWMRLPLGPANRCLVSNGSDAIWNTCLFTGFTAGALPYVDASGNLAQSPMLLHWDNANRRLSVGSNIGGATLTVHDAGQGASSTTLAVRAAQGQGSDPLQRWLDAAGSEVAQVGATGSFLVRSIDAASNASRAAWRESGTASDPSAKQDGDTWYNTTAHARKSFDGGQSHTSPQVVCSTTGATTSAQAVSQLGSCTIPGNLLGAGDRFVIRATWSHGGSNGGFSIRWKWANAVTGTHAFNAAVALADNKGEAAVHATGAVIENSFLTPVGNTGAFLGAVTEAMTNGITVAFEGSVDSASDSLALLQFTVIRYPSQVNP
jgi:hypothetical protein